jgi:hypothetical protein
MRLILSIAALLGTALFSFAHAEILDPYLPKSGVIVGHVMEIAALPEDERIAAKFKQAIEKDAAWFQSYVAKVKNGEPLPYHPRLGITKAEYDRLLHAKSGLSDRGAVSIKVKTDAQGNLGFSADDKASALNEVRLPRGQQYVETPFGNLTTLTDVSQVDAESPTGRWKGVQWKKQDAAGLAVTLAIGRRVPTGDGILYLNVAKANLEQQTLIVIYRMD